VAEDQVLVELRAVLAVQVDVEQLALPQRLRDAVREVEVRHLLVPDLGVHAEQLGVLELPMKASAWPTVGRKMSPRGSFGLGSRAKRRP
jgi:hypothetical protein